MEMTKQVRTSMTTTRSLTADMHLELCLAEEGYVEDLSLISSRPAWSPFGRFPTHIYSNDCNGEGCHKDGHIEVRTPVLDNDTRSCEVIGEDDGVF